MPSLQFKRGTDAQLAAAASASELNEGEVYFITDQDTLAIGLSDNTFSKLNGVSSAIFLKVHLDSFFGMSTSAWRKIPFNVVEVDTDGYWDSVNLRYTPQVPGYYRISAWLSPIGSTTTLQLNAIKNGSVHSPISGYATASYNASGVAIIYLNGTTDYVEVHGYISAYRVISNGDGLYTLQNAMEIAYIGA